MSYGNLSAFVFGVRIVAFVVYNTAKKEWVYINHPFLYDSEMITGPGMINIKITNRMFEMLAL